MAIDSSICRAIRSRNSLSVLSKNIKKSPNELYPTNYFHIVHVLRCQRYLFTSQIIQRRWIKDSSHRCCNDSRNRCSIDTLCDDDEERLHDAWWDAVLLFHDITDIWNNCCFFVF